MPWPFDRRTQFPPSDLLCTKLEQIPDEFVDDGCSNVRDGFLGWNFRPACRAHDADYCTRLWPAGAMTQAHRTVADRDLRDGIKAMLPWRYRWVGWCYRLGVHLGGGVSAFDSCGPTSGGRCRHNMPMPQWMARSCG